MGFQEGFEGVHAKPSGLALGKFKGVEIRIHWSLPGLLAVGLVGAYLRSPTSLHPLIDWLTFACAVAFSVVTHEMARGTQRVRAGERVAAVVLWPLGGLGTLVTTGQPLTELRVAALGPLSALAKAVLAAVVCLVCGWSVLPAAGGPVASPAALFFGYLFLWNSVLLTCNLLPCLPTDGGRMLESIEWLFLEDRRLATLRALRVGRIAALVALGCAIALAAFLFMDRSFAVTHPYLYCVSFVLVLLATTHLVEAKRASRQPTDEEDEGGIFGYDFSQGYTSLEQTTTTERRPRSLATALRNEYHHRETVRRERQEADLNEHLDRLLRQIHHRGLSSLTYREHRFLRRASRRLRKKALL